MKLKDYLIFLPQKEARYNLIISLILIAVSVLLFGVAVAIMEITGNDAGVKTAKDIGCIGTIFLLVGMIYLVIYFHYRNQEKQYSALLGKARGERSRELFKEQRMDYESSKDFYEMTPRLRVNVPFDDIINYHKKRIKEIFIYSVMVSGGLFALWFIFICKASIDNVPVSGVIVLCTFFMIIILVACFIEYKLMRYEKKHCPKTLKTYKHELVIDGKIYHAKDIRKIKMTSYVLTQTYTKHRTLKIELDNEKVVYSFGPTLGNTNNEKILSAQVFRPYYALITEIADWSRYNNITFIEDCH